MAAARFTNSLINSTKSSLGRNKSLRAHQSRPSAQSSLQTTRWLQLKINVPASSPAERILAQLLREIVAILPYRSGNDLTTLQADSERCKLLASLAKGSLNFTLLSMISELDLLNKVASRPMRHHSTHRLQMIDGSDFDRISLLRSQLYLFDLISRCLSASMEGNKVNMDSQIGQQLLVLLTQLLRNLESEGDAVSNLEKISLQDSTSSSVGYISSAQHSSSSLLAPLKGSSTDSIHRPNSSPARKANQTDSTQEKHLEPLINLVQCVASSTWPVFLSVLRTKISHWRWDDSQDPDLLELRLLNWAYLDRFQLDELLKEMQNSNLIRMKRPVQAAIYSAIKTTILRTTLRFSNHFNPVYDDSTEENTAASTLFDDLFVLADGKKKQYFWQWPVLAALICLCPSALAKIGNKQSAKHPNVSKKAEFLNEILRKGLKAEKTAASAVQALVVLLDVGYRITQESSPLRQVGRTLWGQFQNQLDIAQPNLAYPDWLSSQLLTSLFVTVSNIDPVYLSSRLVPAIIASNPRHESRDSIVVAVVKLQEDCELMRLDGRVDTKHFSSVLCVIFTDHMASYEVADRSMSREYNDSARDTILSILDLWTHHPNLAAKLTIHISHSLLDLIAEDSTLGLENQATSVLAALATDTCKTLVAGQASSLSQVISRDLIAILLGLAHLALSSYGKPSYTETLEMLFKTWSAFLQAKQMLLHPSHPAFSSIFHSLPAIILVLEIVFVLNLTHPDPRQSAASLEGLRSLFLLMSEIRFDRFDAKSLLLLYDIQSVQELSSTETTLRNIGRAKLLKPSICVIFEEALRRWHFCSTDAAILESTKPSVLEAESLRCLLFSLTPLYLSADSVQASDLTAALPSSALPGKMLQTSNKTQVVALMLQREITSLFTRPLQKDEATHLANAVPFAFLDLFARQILACSDQIFEIDIESESIRSFAVQILQTILCMRHEVREDDSWNEFTMRFISRFLGLFPAAPKRDAHKEFQMAVCVILNRSVSCPDPKLVLQTLKSWVVANLFLNIDIARRSLEALGHLLSTIDLPVTHPFSTAALWQSFFDCVFPVLDPKANSFPTKEEYQEFRTIAVSTCSRFLQWLPVFATTAIRQQSAPYIRELYLESLTQATSRQRDFLARIDENSSSPDLLSILCRPDLSLALAICQAVPPADDIAEILLNAMGNAGLAESFVQAVLRREILETGKQFFSCLCLKTDMTQRAREHCYARQFAQLSHSDLLRKSKRLFISSFSPKRCA